MNKLTTLLRTPAILLATAVLAQPLQAADIAGEVRSGSDGPETGDGGFLEVGVGAAAWTRPVPWQGRKASVGLVVSGAYRYKGLFVESINGTADGLNLGYQMWNDNQWTVDFIGINATNGRTNEIDPNLGDTARTSWIKDRHTARTGAGLRVTRYFDDYIFQARLLNDVYNHRGNYGSARLGKSWQVRNWNFHAMAGVEYFDSSFAQHIVGISANEASLAFPQYSPGAFAQLETEIGVTYPVNENWVFRATIRNAVVPDTVTDSPMFEDSHASSFFTSLTYVF
jgi:outer membrane protein